MKRENPAGFFKETYDELVANGLDWRPPVLEGPSEGHTQVDGRDMIMLTSNNYLGLSNHPALKEAAVRATEKYGVGSGAVRAIVGTFDLHIELEKKIARFKRTEDAIFYQSGFVANSGLIPQLAGKGDLIISEELNHGSIIDGVRLTKADRAVYKHNDMGELEDILRKSEEYPRILIISDGVFSMDGDIAPVADIVKLAKEYGAITYVDDAHGEGVLGDHGRGIGSHFDVEGQLDMEMGTFSKAFGVVGGLVAGSTDMKRYALNKSRTWLLSGSHPAGVVAACMASLDLLENDDTLVKKLWENREYFKKALDQLGFDTGNSQTPIIPIMTGESKRAKELGDKLFEQGVLGFPIVYPMVAKDKARVRTQVNASLSKEDLDAALNVLEKIGKELKLI